jgi:8-oxo-dGDP phosphatase
MGWIRCYCCGGIATSRTGWGWELTGGLVDLGEDPADAAVRVVEDSAGYRPGRVEHLITFRPMAETVDCEHDVFVGRDPHLVGDPVDTAGVAHAEWVPLASVPELVTAGQVWSSGTLVALLWLLKVGDRDGLWPLPERVGDIE